MRNLWEFEEGSSDFPPYWDPEAQPLLVGWVVRLDEGPTEYQADTPIVVVRVHEDAPFGSTYPADTLVSVWLTRRVLREETLKLDPQVGDLMRFIWRGSRVGGRGQRYHAYDVEKVT
jgi:hypothetical protein